VYEAGMTVPSGHCCIGIGAGVGGVGGAIVGGEELTVGVFALGGARVVGCAPTTWRNGRGRPGWRGGTTVFGGSGGKPLGS
jgi:hypothetical protein